MYPTSPCPAVLEKPAKNVPETAEQIWVKNLGKLGNISVERGNHSCQWTHQRGMIRKKANQNTGEWLDLILKEDSMN